MMKRQIKRDMWTLKAGKELKFKKKSNNNLNDKYNQRK